VRGRSGPRVERRMHAPSGRGAERERPQAPERRDEGLGPGPVAREEQSGAPARAHEPTGRVQQAVAQALALGEAKLAVEDQRLSPGERRSYGVSSGGCGRHTWWGAQVACHRVLMNAFRYSPGNRLGSEWVAGYREFGRAAVLDGHVGWDPRPRPCTDASGSRAEEPFSHTPGAQPPRNERKHCNDPGGLFE
jgi:hypothetical protein